MSSKRIITALGIALLLSLAGNVYFGGLSLGHMMAGSSCDRKEWREKEAVLKERLSPQDYDVLKKHKQQKKKAFRSDRAQLDKARHAVERAMRAEPFDAEALKTALANESKVKLEVLERMREGRDQLSADLSPEGRKVFTDVMRNFHPGRGGDGLPRGPRGDDAPPPPQD